jgi:hypothetical protein
MGESIDLAEAARGRVVPDDYWREGAILLARAAHGSRLHAGRLNIISATAASMTPLCLRYRKPNGERLAKHLSGSYPMLVGFTAKRFAEVVDDPRYIDRLCRHCVAVFQLPDTVDALDEERIDG